MLKHCTRHLDTKYSKLPPHLIEAYILGCWEIDNKQYIVLKIICMLIISYTCVCVYTYVYVYIYGMAEGIKCFGKKIEQDKEDKEWYMGKFQF